ncbi:cell wall-binding repeat-containing protein [Neobacillus sp. OS1-2]|uniref:cell wall-binding repeat-containing protein n=1 Tax=Neobacillus sp. OS1-2 TaxID=3070680 RepID=UPI0027DF1DD3|nr:cell wall-binding repeat-containing protein [Neobacillus sp. OS1-2]WML41218.1 cell wall-binding repeat-containing protein [Neobacillus sp. OS1-2]
MNKKELPFLKFLLAVLLVFTVSAPAYANSALIPDPNLDEAIKYSMDLYEDEDYTVEDLNDLDGIWGYEQNISSLSGLENAKNLEYLNLANNNITDISPLKNLTKLSSLVLSSNNITDISPLKNLNQLSGLDLSYNHIKDISALASLSVTGSVYFDLDLSNNEITSLDALKNLKNLNSLYAANNNISSISSLSGLTNIQYLDLSSNHLSSLQGLTVTKEVYYYYNLSDNELTNISNLANVTQGEFLLEGNLITDLSPLQNMTFGALYLTGNPLNSNSLAIIEKLRKRNVFVDYAPTPGREIERVSGSTRYSTAVEISKQGWNTADTVIIARGDDFPDALAGASLAYKLDAPILLTNKDVLSVETATEIKRLKASKAIILGGTSAVSAPVEANLKALNMTTERIAGSNRFETAKLIAERLGGNPDTAIVAYGYDFPDALSVASYAAKNGYPILLTNKEALPKETSDSLIGKAKTIVIGGEGVISNQVYTKIPGAQRITGENRYATGANLINTLKLSTDKVFVANGRGFADALTGSVLVARENASLLLVEKNYVPAEIGQVISKNRVNHVTVLGGEEAVSMSTTNEIETLPSR